MNTHADKTQENKSQSVANDITQKQSSSESTFQFVDNRPEAVAHRKLQDMANNSPQLKQAAQLRAMADNYSAKQQQPIKKKENNTGLPDNLKTGMEDLSGMSLDNVKVHRNSDKPAQMQAHAYAQGTDIHLGPGQEKHLPHEAWHVVQQKQGRVKPTMQLKGKVNVNNDVGLEIESDVMGTKALQMKPKEKKSNEKQGLGFVDNRPIQNEVIQKMEIASSGVIQLKLPVDSKLRQLTWQGLSEIFKPGREHINKFNLWQAILNHIKSDNFIGESQADVERFIDKNYPGPHEDSQDKVSSEKLKSEERQVEDVEKKEQEEEKPLEKAMQNTDTPDEFQVDSMRKKEEETEEMVEQEKIPSGAQSILDQYSEGGLLVHTIQVENAKYEADNLIITLEDALHNQDQVTTGKPAKKGQKPGHSGKRNWSLIHEQITCNPYDMGDNGKRFMGVLAQMKDVSNKYLKIYLADASSNSRIQEKQEILEEKEALSQIGSVLKELKQKESEGDNNNNSEIQTLGIDPNALGGLLFYKVKTNMFKKSVQPQSWEEAKPLFQNAINEMASRGGRKSYYIFTYSNESDSKSGESKLIYIQTMNAQQK